jgi:hypothetical protein
MTRAQALFGLDRDQHWLAGGPRRCGQKVPDLVEDLPQFAQQECGEGGADSHGFFLWQWCCRHCNLGLPAFRKNLAGPQLHVEKTYAIGCSASVDVGLPKNLLVPVEHAP